MERILRRTEVISPAAGSQTLTTNVRAVLLPQALFAVTVIFPLIVPR